MAQFKTLWRASALLAFFSFVAKVTALWRDRILASQFGASPELDVYYSAFKVPDFIFNLFILGAVSSAFIPVFLEHYRQDRSNAWRITQNFLTSAFLVVLVACSVLFIFADPAARLIAPGFSADQLTLLVKLLRLMLLSPIIFSISTILGSVLQALERFFAYALAPVFYNLGIIIGALYGVPFALGMGWDPVMGLGLGVLLGAILHLLIQIPSAQKAGFRFRFIIDWTDRGFRKIIRLMIPRTLGLGAYSVEAIITNAIASTLSSGAITVLQFATNIAFVPISVVGVSVATAVFPRLSSHASDENEHQFHARLFESLKKTALGVGVLAVLMLIFRERIIQIIFETGAFQGASVTTTASALGLFMFGVVAHSLIPIMSRAFYALQNTITPVLVSIFSIALNVLLAIWFTFGLNWGIYGLALAFSIAGNVNFLLLYVLFRRRYL